VLACHGIDGAAVAMLFPSLAQSSVTRAQRSTTPSGWCCAAAKCWDQRRADRAGMPSFGWQLNDAQIAAVLTYVRNAWQTAAAPVPTETVGKAATSFAPDPIEKPASNLVSAV